MNKEFSFKELYDVTLNATYPIEINSRTIEKGETIAYFDKISIANIKEIKSFVSAHGGFEDRDRVIWESTKSVTLSFSQGIFNKVQLALMSNSKLINVLPNAATAYIRQREVLESDVNGIINLKYKPLSKVYVYNAETAEKLNYETVGEATLKIAQKFLNVIVDYTFGYTNGDTCLEVGERLFESYVSLQGKTKIQDDITGQIKTGIISIPKLKLMSNLSIQLGSNANPLVGNFNGTAFPVGEKGSINSIMEIAFLSDDIDSDF